MGEDFFDIQPLPACFRDPDARPEQHALPLRCRRRRLNEPAMTWPPPLDPARTRAERAAIWMQQPTRYTDAPAMPSGPSLPVQRENVTRFDPASGAWVPMSVQQTDGTAKEQST